MGTEIATLLSAEPNANRVNATFLWVTSHPGGWRPLFLQCATNFLLPGESYLLPILKRLGATG